MFLGRRVYLGAVIVLASALGQGLSTQRRAVPQRFGLSERTWLRWRRWWRESVPSTRHWIAIRALLAQPIDPHALPGALLDALTATDARSKLSQTLLLLLPFSTRTTHSSMRVADPQKLRLSPPWTVS